MGEVTYPTNLSLDITHQAHELFRYDAPEAYVVPAVFSLIFLVGTVGNGTLIYTVARNKNMRSTANILIASLAAGDLLLVLASVPFRATSFSFQWWPYGLVICKLEAFVNSLSLGVSALTLAALSGENYRAIVRATVSPMSLQQRTSMVRTVLIASCIWVLSLGLATLDAVVANLVPAGINREAVTCNFRPHWWDSWLFNSFWISFRFIFYFALPLLIIAGFYLMMARRLITNFRQMSGDGQTARQMKAQRKVARIIFSFVIIFVFCWLPHHVYLFYLHLENPYTHFWEIFVTIAYCLSFASSCLNPVALYFVSPQFRAYFNSYLCRCCPRRNQDRGAIDHNTESQTTL